MSATSPPISLITPDPGADEARRRGLRQMRTVAVGLLLLAACVYVATLGRDGFWGFVNAGAEASMVGAIADWFAVTALFKHPLGLPIPHTALIPRRKDELGKGLEEFVGENFLQEAVIRERVAAATISARVGDWLSDPANARRVVDEVSDVAAIALGNVRDDHIADLVTEALVPRFREEPISPLLGTTLMEVLRDDLHHGVVDLVVDEMHRWLVDNPDTFARVLGERAPWWAPPKLNDAVTTRIHFEARRVDGGHPRRPAPPRPRGSRLDARPARPRPAQRPGDDGPRRGLQEPPARAPAGRHHGDLALEGDARRPCSARSATPRAPCAGACSRSSTRSPAGCARTPALRERLDRTAADVAVFMIARYGAELTTVITHTIERWDGKEAARRIELHVGRDLQFIRINGTIVGGLVGVVIHAVSLAV